MDAVAKSLLLLLAVMVGLLAFRRCCATDETEDLKMRVNLYSNLARSLTKKCKAREELIQTQAEYIKTLEEVNKRLQA